MKQSLRIIPLLLLVFCATSIFGQVSFESRAELEKAANEFFEAGQYDKAKPLYSQLLSLSALEPNYNYRFGVCVLYTEADAMKPLPYIEGGANSAGVNVEAFYFLGKAQQLNYRFDLAVENYQKAKAKGYKNDKVDLDKAIDECRNGRILYNPSIDFQPAQNKDVLESEFYRPYDFRKLKGKVIPLPPTFKTKYDEKNLKGTFVFTPSNSQSLIYASYGEDGANKKDLYRVNRLPNGEWSLAQRLPNTINSKYDEDYAFFDEESNTLYFASKGHNTMGGYDIFRSTYTPENNQWSTPVNLQHPINSPFDDFLYISDPSGKVAFFTSGRDSDFGKLRVFKTLLYDTEQVLLSVVKGSYEDRSDSTYNYMVATVFDPKTNEVLGKFKSHPETGKYLFILPPQNQYKVDVAPKEATGFEFKFDLPKHEDGKPLKQELVYNAKGEDATVKMTNFFNSSGEKDSVSIASTLPRNEVESKMIDVRALPELAALEQSRQNRLEAEKAEKLKVLAEQEKANLEAELARKDSIARAEEIALARNKAIADSIAENERLANEREQFVADSLAKAEELALKKEQAKAEKLKELAEQEKAKLEAELTRKDSLVKAEEIAAEHKKAIADSIAEIELLAKQREQLIADSLAKAEELAVQLALEKEKTRADSIANMQLFEQQTAERKKVVQDSIAEVKALAKEREKHVADSLALAKIEREREDLVRRDSIAKAQADLAIELAREKAITDSLKQVQLAKIQAEQEEADSIAELERIALEKAEQMKQDSILAAEENAKQDSIALIAAAEAERRRLEEIDREVELAKQKALADSLGIINSEEELTTETEDFDALLVEMQQKEAEILEQQKETEVKAASNDEVALSESDTSETSEMLSEADLFLQRIADLEKQKAQQEAEVKAENERLAADRARKVDETKASKDSTLADSGRKKNLVRDGIDTASVAANVTTPNGEKDLEFESVALKSDADPNEYLAALAEIEKQIEEDAKSNSKTYELADLPVETTIKSDPKLEEMLAEDRKVIEAHKAVAAEKEEELRKKMEQDRAALDAVTKDGNAEIAQVEAELLNDLEKKGKLKAKLGATEQQEVVAVDNELKEEIAPPTTEATEKVEEKNADSDELELIAEAEEIVQVTETEVEEPEAKADATPDQEEVLESGSKEVAEPEEEELELMAEAEEVLEKASATEEELVNVEVSTKPELSDTIALEVEEATEIIGVKITGESEKTISEATELVELISESEEAIQEVVEEHVQEVTNAEELTNEVANSELSDENEDAELVEDLLENTSASNIHLMEAALRDYSKRKPDFSSIENASMRRMVKRMRAEDIGRLAVIKNMKNQWVEAGKSQEALSEIKLNVRNQEVLANLIEPQAREEKLRNPFSKNDLKRREGVYYKLQFNVVASRVSETIQECLSPEQSMTFSMPEFNLTTDFFETISDARSEMRYYKSRGFDRVKIVAFKNNEPIGLSDVENIPFVD